LADVAAFSILALTVSLSLARPRIGRFRIHHAQAGIIGSVLTVALGVLPLDMLVVAARLLAVPVITIVSLMVITLVAEKAGLFDILASRLAEGARGSGPALFASIFFTGTLVGTVFTNDAAVLIFTPLVFVLVERIAGPDWGIEKKLPFYFAVLYVANLVGGLVIANPINIVVSSLFQIGFVEYARWMLLPAAVSIVVSFVGLKLFVGKWIPRRFELPAGMAVRHRMSAIQWWCAGILLLALVAFFAEPWTGIPTWSVALLGALAMLILHRTVGKRSIRPVFRGVGWDVVIFLCGMFIVGMGIRNVGFTHVLGGILSDVSGGDPSRLRFSSGMLAATCSAIINNHPTAGMMAWVIQDFHLPVLDQKTLAFAALIGGDLGPKMLPIGSLAALMWFRLLRDRGVEIPYSLYVKIGIPVTLAALVASLLTLNLEVWLSSVR
jgi:arsenical pump membrane protein